IVQPSVYGVDNACTLDAMKKLGPARARGVAVIDKTISQGQLDDLAAAGMCGVRLNFETAGETNTDNARRRVVGTAEEVRGRDWHIQFNAALPLVAALKDELAAAPMPVVIDHFARAKAKDGVNQPGLDVLLALVKSGKSYVKLSAAYRISDQAPHYPDSSAIGPDFLAQIFQVALRFGSHNRDRRKISRSERPVAGDDHCRIRTGPSRRSRGPLAGGKHPRWRCYRWPSNGP